MVLIVEGQVFDYQHLLSVGFAPSILTEQVRPFSADRDVFWNGWLCQKLIIHNVKLTSLPTEGGDEKTADLRRVWLSDLLGIRFFNLSLLKR